MDSILGVVVELHFVELQTAGISYYRIPLIKDPGKFKTLYLSSAAGNTMGLGFGGQADSKVIIFVLSIILAQQQVLLVLTCAIQCQSPNYSFVVNQLL